MIDPLLSLAFSMQSNPGVFALLLGSGVSQASKVPTGWAIMLELIRKIAVLVGEDCDPDPESWYFTKFGNEPTYSSLLDAVAKTRTERQQLLRSYFEPNEQERDEGLKQPTDAHHAIATLVQQKIIRVIVTTNFDKLLEVALTEVGVVPMVLSSVDQLRWTHRSKVPPFSGLT